ncbi:MAG: F0F1 ATP synthase subunit A [Nitrospirota bacterium]|nr:F0F1 ATP synthase subunit A [Nitrospirota bacterium]
MGQTGHAGGPLFHIGPVGVTQAIVTTWGIMLVLALACWLGTRRLRLDPGPAQVVLEGALTSIDGAIRAVLPTQSQRVLPFIGTLWVYIVVANLSGLIPGVEAPTADLSVTSALAILVFLSVHWFGIRAEGVRAYLRHYLDPSPIMLPFHILSEITRTLTLAVRLFGNIMSLEMAALLVLLVGGLLVPIPLLLLHIVEALIQAYIFGMLALVYIAGAIQAQQLKRQKEKE